MKPVRLLEGSLQSAILEHRSTGPATQNNLGTALATLGERESGTKRLEQAVKAFLAALEVRTRKRVPLQWAATQNNLGNALQTLGERDNGTKAWNRPCRPPSCP